MLLLGLSPLACFVFAHWVRGIMPENFLNQGSSGQRAPEVHLRRHRSCLQALIQLGLEILSQDETALHCQKIGFLMIYRYR
jgi:hypothetical protein